MPQATVSANFPSSKTGKEELGVFTNKDRANLDEDITSTQATFSVTDTSVYEPDMYVALFSTQYEITRIKSIDAAAGEVTCYTDGSGDRQAFDGTNPKEHFEGDTLLPGAPAKFFNQTRAEIVGMQDWLGADGDTITWDRALQLRYTGTSGEATLSIGTVSGQGDPEPLIDFERSTDSGDTWSRVGGVKYDPTNDELELDNINLVAAASSHIELEDNQELRFGTDEDFLLRYNPSTGANGAFEIRDKANNDTEAKFLSGGGIEFSQQTIEVVQAQDDDIFKLVNNANSDAARYYWDSSGRYLLEVNDESASTKRDIWRIDPASDRFEFVADVRATPPDVTSDGGTQNSPILSLRAKHDSDTSASVTSSDTDYTAEFVSQVSSGNQDGHVLHEVGSNTNQFVLGSGGNVGIGTVPSSSSPFEVVDGNRRWFFESFSSDTPLFRMKHEATPTAGDGIGFTIYHADDDAATPNDVSYARTRVTADTVTSGSVGGGYHIETMQSGTMTTVASFTENGRLGLGDVTSPNFRYHQTGGTYAHLGVQESSPTNSDMDNQSLIFWLDDTNNELEIVVKNSSGTVKTGTVAVS